MSEKLIQRLVAEGYSVECEQRNRFFSRWMVTIWGKYPFTTSFVCGFGITRYSALKDAMSDLVIEKQVFSPSKKDTECTE